MRLAEFKLRKMRECHASERAQVERHLQLFCQILPLHPVSRPLWNQHNRSFLKPKLLRSSDQEEIPYKGLFRYSTGSVTNSMDQNPVQGDLNWRLSAHPITLLVFLGIRIGLYPLSSAIRTALTDEFPRCPFDVPLWCSLYQRLVCACQIARTFVKLT